VSELLLAEQQYASDMHEFQTAETTHLCTLEKKARATTCEKFPMYLAHSMWTSLLFKSMQQVAKQYNNKP
jgi:hypothetical protein